MTCLLSHHLHQPGVAGQDVNFSSLYTFGNAIMHDIFTQATFMCQEGMQIVGLFVIATGSWISCIPEVELSRLWKAVCCPL